MKRGEVYEWLPPGTDSCLGDVRPVAMVVFRSARDETWADIACTAVDGRQWHARHPTAPGCTPMGWRKVREATSAGWEVPGGIEIPGEVTP